MKPNELFKHQDKAFWAHIRTLSEKLGYTVRGKNVIYVPAFDAMVRAMHSLGLDTDHLQNSNNGPSDYAKTLIAYFQYRADVLNDTVQGQLMDASEAKQLFDDTRLKLGSTLAMPMNKQKGEKKAVAYLTALVNMLIYEAIKGFEADFDPRTLTTITRQGRPLRTLARRVDGTFPRSVNPIAIWEIKEYYYTTTFGSRVADGVYETLLDGMELEEIQREVQDAPQVLHYLIVDAHYTWWVKGKSYLCRLIDMLHMGYVDEVLFGREVVHRLPALALEWRELAVRAGYHPVEVTPLPPSLPLETET